MSGQCFLHATQGAHCDVSSCAALLEERAGSLTADARAELLHAVACHHDLRAARTAEAAALYHANQLDAVAATRPVDSA